TRPTEISTLSLHDALPILNATSNYRTGFATGGYEGRTWSAHVRVGAYVEHRGNGTLLVVNHTDWRQYSGDVKARVAGGELKAQRSEEHTSELQSLAYLVCR